MPESVLQPDTAGILLVDDKPDNLRLLSNILKNRGYAIRMLREGSLVLSSAQNFPPDVILLDIMMPGMTGYEVCEQLKANPQTRDIPVIFLSALNDIADKVKAFAAGGVDYITKPFQEEEVLTRVQTHLAVHSMRQRLERQNARLQQEIDEHRRAEAQLRQAKSEAETARRAAEEANMAKSAFLANMSHELRTPLNGIMGYAQILRRDAALSEQHRQQADTIERSGQYLLTLINDILDLAKVEAGKVELTPEDFDLRALINDIQTIIQVRADRKGLALRVNLPPGLPQRAHGDPYRLRQILLNLLGNAVKFTEQGSVTLKITYCRLTIDDCQQNVAPEQSSIVNFQFSISDTGVGIAPEALDRIFDPFQQVGSRTYQQQGTGLGLAITRNLAQLMGGDLSVSSVPGAGSTFRVDLPLPVAASAPAADVSPQRRIIGIQGPTPAILVVDDQADNRALLVDLLTSVGFNVCTAVDGEDALRQAGSTPFAVVITDIRMPGMDGLELIRRIRQSPDLRDLVVIAASASVYREDRQRSLDAGCQAFVPKPIDIERLFDELRAALPRLEWVYQEDAPPSGVPPLPPTVYLDILDMAAQIGDIQDINDTLDALEQQMPAMSAFIAELRSMTREFQIGRIQTFLQACRPSASQTPPQSPSVTNAAPDLTDAELVAALAPNDCEYGKILRYAREAQKHDGHGE